MTAEVRQARQRRDPTDKAAVPGDLPGQPENPAPGGFLQGDPVTGIREPADSPAPRRRFGRFLQSRVFDVPRAFQRAETARARRPRRSTPPHCPWRRSDWAHFRRGRRGSWTAEGHAPTPESGVASSATERRTKLFHVSRHSMVALNDMECAKRRSYTSMLKC